MESDVLGLPLLYITLKLVYANKQHGGIWLQWPIFIIWAIVDNIVFQFYEHIVSIPYLVLWFMSSVFYRVSLISCIYISWQIYFFCNLWNWLFLLVYVSNFKISSFLLTYEEVVGFLKWTLSPAIISHLFQMWLFPKSRSVIIHLTCMATEIQYYHIV